MNKFSLILFLLISINAKAQFTGHSGVYYLGSSNIPVNTTHFTNPNISGIVVRFTWDELERTPNNFDWTFIDTEITKAINANKKISLQPLGVPHWLDSIGAQQYYYIDKNTAHTTYGKVVSNVLPWDSTYISRYENLLQHLSVKYSANSTVSYINAIGVAFSRGLPDTVLTDTSLLTQQPFWTAYNFNADTLGHIMNQVTDYYMSLFPTTPLWCSVDYVLFQPSATGQARNYLASIYCNYGISHYPERFGLFREDISACNPQPTISTGSQWYIMQQNACRTGAQMLWSVQDGPSRMNQCGVLPNTKTMVLDSAVNKALALGMRYVEVYGVDIADASLATSIQQANTKLIAKGASCTQNTGLGDVETNNEFSIYPNPATTYLTIQVDQNKETEVQLFNTFGMLVDKFTLTQTTEINISNLPKGVYLLYYSDAHTTSVIKFVVSN